MKKLFILFGLFLIVSCQPPPSTFSLALLGDLMIGRGANPTMSSLAYLAPDLQTADVRLANLESPLAGLPSAVDTPGGYNLCAAADRAALLAAWHLDLLSLANNHQYDCGPAGSSETIRILTAAGLTAVGPGPQPLYRQINGLKLAFLSFDDILSSLDGSAAARVIRAARAEEAMVVVSVHWGLEYQSGPSDRQKALAQQFAEAGAALVVGTHPHVLQPAEWLSTARGKTLVLYSLGNALFDQPGLPDTRQSALVLVVLDRLGVRSARLVPFEIDVPRSLLIQPDAQAAKMIRERLQIP